MIPSLRISLLGSLSFELNDKPLASLTSLKAQALLIYLAATGRTHTRASLAGLLWPDVLETAAYNSLRGTLAHLRQAVGDYIDATRQSIALNTEHPIWLDVTEFVQACSRLQHAEATLAESEYQGLRTGVHLYRGEFVSGFYIPTAELFEEWVVAERAYYGRMALEALTRLGTLALQRGSPTPGIEDVQAALFLDPLLEEAHQLLMRLYAHNGQITLALRQYEECVRLLDKELGVSPAAETVALVEAIRTRSLAVPAQIPGVTPSLAPGADGEAARRPRHNLPHQTTPFIGRKSELANLKELLAEPAPRLVTLVAPGGMGKTRLAQEAALAQLDHFADGAYFVAMAPLSRAEELAPAIADAVYYPMQADNRSAQEQLLDFLRRKQMLLVLDNFEHLLDVADLVTTILQAAGAVKILVTSRERLRLSSESILALGGLDLPSEQATEWMEGADAVKLFVQHARHAMADFKLTDANLAAVVQICRLTYGMPLGIILAAAWVSLLPVEEIAAEIEQSLDFLEADLRDLPERQRSLASIFAHTWQRLQPAEQETFMRLAVFRNGFDRQAAQLVAGATTRLLLQLADKALLQRNTAGRYEIHELLRQYGLRMLDRAGVANSAYEAHSRYFLNFLHTLAADLKGRRQLAALAEIEADLDNIRAAWSWALASDMHTGMDRGMEAFALFYTLRGRNLEGAQTFWRAYQSLDHEGAHALALRALVGYGLVQMDLYEWEQNIDDQFGRAVIEAEATGDQAELAACWLAWGCHEQRVAWAEKRPTFDIARGYFEQGLVYFRALNDEYYLSRTLRSIANCYGYDIATMEQHQAFHAVSLDYARRAGSIVDEVDGLGSMGWAAVDMGQFADAERYFGEATTLLSELISPGTVAFVKVGLAYVHFLQGRLETARWWAEDGLMVAREFNAVSRESQALCVLSLVAALAEDVATALHLSEQSLGLPCDKYFRTYSNWGYALIHCGLGKLEVAWRHLRASHQSVQVPSSISRMLAVAAVLQGQEGNPQRAVELLGAAFHHRQSAHGWMEQWRPLTALRARLQAALGAAAFQALWDRGAQLNAEQLADELLGAPTGP